MSAPTYQPLAKLSDKRGLALFEEIIEEIEQHQFVGWDQTGWIGHVDGEDDIPLARLRPDVRETLIPAFDCGTVACLFGHAVFKAGAKMVVYRAFLHHDDSDGGTLYVSYSSVMTADGERRSIAHYAAELLELPTHLAVYISSPAREWAEVIQFRDAWRADVAAGGGAANRNRIAAGYDL